MVYAVGGGGGARKLNTQDTVCQPREWRLVLARNRVRVVIGFGITLTTKLKSQIGVVSGA